MTQLFDSIILKAGSHKLPSEGSCILEVVHLFIGNEWKEVKSASDAPACVSPVLAQLAMAANDMLEVGIRQRLIPFIPLLPNTAGTEEQEMERVRAAEARVMFYATSPEVFHAAVENNYYSLGPQLRARELARVSFALSPWGGLIFDVLQAAFYAGPSNPVQVDDAAVVERLKVLQDA